MDNVCSLSGFPYWPLPSASISLAWGHCLRPNRSCLSMRPCYPRQEYTGLAPSLMGQPTVLPLLLHIFSMGSIWSLSSLKSELLLRSYLSCKILLPPFIFFWENFTVGLLAQEFTPQALCLWNLTQDTTLGFKLPEVRQWVSFIHCSISSTRTLPDICRCLNYFEWLC